MKAALWGRAGMLHRGAQLDQAETSCMTPERAQGYCSPEDATALAGLFLPAGA